MGGIDRQTIGFTIDIATQRTTTRQKSALDRRKRVLNPLISPSASRLLKAIEGTTNPTRSPLQHVRINHRCGNIGMAQQLLHGTNVSTAFKQVRRETMTKRVTTRLFDDP